MSDKMLGFHFDLKRAMWKREYMDAFCDQLKAWGYNTILYELEDKFRFRNHPAVVHTDAFSHEETADFVASCRNKGLQVVPLVQTLAHSESVVGKPEYAHLRESLEHEEQYDPFNDEARALILEFIDEIIEVMRPETYFHLGADETRSLGSSERGTQAIREIGIGGLYMQHLLPIIEHVHERGLRPIIWADMVLLHPYVLENIPKYVVMMEWDYTTQGERLKRARATIGDGASHLSRNLSWNEIEQQDTPSFDKYMAPYAVDEQTRKDGSFRPFYRTDALVAAGFDVITASATRCSGDMIGTPASRHLGNCFHSARKGAEAGIGNVVTCWAVRHNHPELSLPSIHAASRAFQNGSKFDARELTAAFAASQFGAEMPELPEALALVQPGFLPCRAEQNLRIRKREQEGEDAIADAVRKLTEEHGGKDGAASLLKKLQEDYARARDTFEGLKNRATHNADEFDYWLEGIDVNAFHAQFWLALVEGNLEEARPALLDRLTGLRENTRQLFARTYPAQSVEEEVDVRYGLIEECLKP